jgi:DNA-binding GntR family transcriptional regulator
MGGDSMIGLVGQPGSVTVPTEYPYLRVTRELRRRIREGVYLPGEQLPSRSAMAAEFGVSDIVIGAAMRALKAEGLTEPMPGIGTFVADPLPPAARSTEADDPL